MCLENDNGKFNVILNVECFQLIICLKVFQVFWGRLPIWLQSSSGECQKSKLLVRGGVESNLLQSLLKVYRNLCGFLLQEGGGQKSWKSRYILYITILYIICSLSRSNPIFIWKVPQFFQSLDSKIINLKFYMDIFAIWN